MPFLIREAAAHRVRRAGAEHPVERDLGTDQEDEERDDRPQNLLRSEGSERKDQPLLTSERPPKYSVPHAHERISHIPLRVKHNAIITPMRSITLPIRREHAQVHATHARTCCVIMKVD